MSGSRGLRLRRDEEFGRFVAGFLPALLKGAYLLVHDVDLAEDAVQGTLLRVYRRWDEARAAPEAYSRTALISVCRDFWRRDRRRPREVLSGDGSMPERPAAGSFSDEWNDRDALSQALSGLARQQQEVLVLRFFFDFSVEQTAEFLGIAEGTVKSATHRGLQELRSLLSPPQSEVTA